MSEPVTYSVDADGVGWIVFDDPESRANLFTQRMQAALAAVISAAENDVAKALVIVSAKEHFFIAGADLKSIDALSDARVAEEFSRAGQRLFQRLADFRVPIVCAIHGACAGGGFELALACHWRIASDATRTQIGLPETSVGTIPGWGGTVRLPRIVGVKPALDHILKAQLIGPREARESGFIHELVPAAELRARAKVRALQLAKEGHPVAAIPAAPMPGFFGPLRESVRTKTGGHQPALLAAIDVVEQTSQLAIFDALEIEARIFADVTVGDVCKNLLHVFFLRDGAKKRTLDGWFPSGTSSTKSDVQHLTPERKESAPALRVGVVGAGVMGSGITHWLALRGCEVVMRDVDSSAIDRAIVVIRELFDGAVERGKLAGGEANAALHRITTTTEWEGFAKCDVVIEAIVENVAAKRALFAEISRVVGPETILASNTSALPIQDIAGHVGNPSRTVGIHFFNPVSRMPLVEIIVGPQTSARTAGRVLDLVKTLGKSPVICRSSPGFLVTRVLFFYLSAAVRLWEQGVSVEAIDTAMREFGWPMGPMRLIDEVGVDVADFIFGEMEHYFPERFTRSTVCAQMAAADLKGRKNGASSGFYSYAGREAVNESVARYSVGRVGDLALSADEIITRLMRVMVEEAERCLAEGVVKSADEIDFALLSGAGFPAFRGGLLRWARRATP